MSSKYRPEIDGLRAIAVLSVVFYHLGSTWFPGGFVGVDIFFVISGYLITKLIVEEFEATGGVSFPNFYKRRMARLFPALFVVVFASFVGAVWIAPPTLFAAFAESAIGALLSVSNLVFWNQSGYFDVQNVTKPLLHTWSLSVEEQFYLVWPFLLVLCLRRSRALPWIVLALLATASLAGAMLMHDDRASIYYLLPFRVFELGIGGGLVWIERVLPKRRGADALAALGFAAMLYPVFAYSDRTLFPSYNALLPCVGTALLMYVGTASPVAARILSNRLFVPIGLISYSLYLVHWPLLVFFRLLPTGLDAASPAVQAGLFAAMLLLAAALYRFVEQPMRRIGAKVRFPRAATAAAIAAALLVVPAAHAWRTGGWTWRYSEDIGRLTDMQAAKTDVPMFPRECFLSKGRRPEDLAAGCYRAQDNGRTNLLLLGDSTAFHLTHGLAARLRSQANVLAYATYGCPILPGYGHDRNPECRGNSRYFYERILPHNRYDIVLISANEDVSGLKSAMPRAVRAIEATGAKVVLVGQTPVFHDTVPNLIGLHGRTDGLGAFLATRLRTGCRGELGLDALVAPGRFFSVADVVCGPDGVRYEADGYPLFVDGIHFGTRGSAFIAAEMIGFMNRNLGTSFRVEALVPGATAPAAIAGAPAAPAEVAAVVPAEAEVVRRDLHALQRALADYRAANGRYPKSVGFDGLFTKYGAASEQWIAGLAPTYIAALPRDPRRTQDPNKQYLYLSNGTDYKLIAHGIEGCGSYRSATPELIDPKRDCFAVGVWSPGGRDW